VLILEEESLKGITDDQGKNDEDLMVWASFVVTFIFGIILYLFFKKMI
jgi:hypothetical protein